MQLTYKNSGQKNITAEILAILVWEIVHLIRNHRAFMSFVCLSTIRWREFEKLDVLEQKTIAATPR